MHERLACRRPPLTPHSTIDSPIRQFTTVRHVLERLARDGDAGDEEREREESLDRDLESAKAHMPRSWPIMLSQVTFLSLAGRCLPRTATAAKTEESREGPEYLRSSGEIPGGREPSLCSGLGSAPMLSGASLSYVNRNQSLDQLLAARPVEALLQPQLSGP